MKNFLFILVLTLFVGVSMSGCATWHGVKKDATRTWDVVTS